MPNYGNYETVNEARERLSLKAKTALMASAGHDLTNLPQETKQAIRDLLASLAHLCDWQNLIFADLLRAATNHYLDENPQGKQLAKDSYAPVGAEPKTLKCDMGTDCTKTVTHIGDRGYIYCSECAITRRQSCNERTRRMTAKELKQLRAGQSIAKY